ncbi:MAG: ABC transporter ATP-binding protein [Candidatus Dormibacteria bacterium]
MVAIAVVLIAVVALAAVVLVRRARRRSSGDPEATPADRATDPDPAPSPGAAIAVRHLTKTYRLGRVSVQALADVSLDVPQGAMVCVMGKSGSGKSTLLRQVGLIDRPSGGRVWLNGEDATALSDAQRTRLRLARLGYVFQEYALIPELTAQENIALPAMMQGRRSQECRERAAELLQVVGLGDRAAHRPKELSGGEQQRVAIARALVNRPTIVFADEPTANLDSISARVVMETLRKLNEVLEVTVVFVSHDPDDAQYSTRLVHLRDGRLTEDGA